MAGRKKKRGLVLVATALLTGFSGTHARADAALASQPRGEGARVSSQVDLRVVVEDVLVVGFGPAGNRVSRQSRFGGGNGHQGSGDRVAASPVFVFSNSLAEVNIAIPAPAPESLGAARLYIAAQP